jgi:hypothetical protein
MAQQVDVLVFVLKVEQVAFLTVLQTNHFIVVIKQTVFV